MRFCSLLVLAFSIPAASAHFAYVVPEGPNKGRVVFSDNLKADEKVTVERLANLKLQLVTDGKAEDIAMTLDKKANLYRIEVPGGNARVVAGSINYGVLQRGDAKPFLLKYYPKAIFGDWSNGAGVMAGKAVPLEISPVKDGAKIRFLVTHKGQPLAKAEVSVLIPGEEKAKTVATDETGHTEFFEKAGQYGAQTKHAEATVGEVDGKKYDEERLYATLVVTIGK
ncbi:DUF4198 domain-containing protein [Zavarzinella formosa]|uniref:DUF4198 domain-containing protein n=1 Tax=Zavarzinella formosa TaxID=360055 RepID=UPI0002FF39B2|nr:DUF4198 domain-containing protein [Zavarzinella formosa]